MAGAGFKDFAVGEVLTASDVDTYLMQQSVMRFADSAARGSALGTATGAGTALAEGMVSYLDDVNAVQVYDGSGWTTPLAGIGSNVVQTVKLDAFTTASDSYTDVTGLAVTITPTSASSKVLVICNVFLSQDQNTGSAGAAYLQIVGGNAGTFVGDADGSRVRTTSASWYSELGQFGRLSGQSATVVYLDSPASASPVQYKAQVRRGNGGNVLINRRGDDGSNLLSPAASSSIIAIEVAA